MVLIHGVFFDVNLQNQGLWILLRKRKWTENKIKDFFTCVVIKIIFFTLGAIVLFVSQSYHTCVIFVALLLHWCLFCCSCDVLVFLVSRLCCSCVVFVALMLFESDARVVRWTRSNRKGFYYLSILNYFKISLF